MPSQDDLYGQMEQLLDLLIQTTKRLCEMAKHLVTEDELDGLQQRQAEILREVAHLDGHIKKSIADSPVGVLAARRERIHQKLVEFQAIDKEFIAHMEDHTRLIQKKKLSSNAQESIDENHTEH
jgi:hypothetical protein